MKTCIIINIIESKECWKVAKRQNANENKFHVDPILMVHDDSKVWFKKYQFATHYCSLNKEKTFLFHVTQVDSNVDVKYCEGEDEQI